MPVVTQQAPRFTVEAAEGLARSRYGMAATARPLPSYLDQNFLLETDAGDRFVLKVANAAEDRAVLDFQQAALQHLAAHHPAIPCQRVRPTAAGTLLTDVEDDDGVPHLVWMVTYLPGCLMGHVRPHTPGLLRSLGAFLGTLDEALEGFAHPAMHRYLPWDLMRVLDLRPDLACVGDLARRALVERFLGLFEAYVMPAVPHLRAGVIHDDANDHNVLVGTAAGWEYSVTGVIDFGDMVHTVTACEPAIAAAYAMLGKADPLAAAAHVVGGYHAVNPLSEPELDVLFPLVAGRLCASVLISARRKRLEPENDYLTISEQPAWTLLERLAGVHPHFAHYTFRQACGLAPCPASARVTAWLEENAAVAPVVAPDPCTAPVAVFDFSVGSTEWSHDDLTVPMLATEAIFARLRAEGAAVGVGRYDEARLVYTAPQFRPEGSALREGRTIHLGIDLFQEPGSPVYAPLDGAVHSFADNALSFDYGPTIILAHHPVGSPPFYTLYGHLSRASLEGLYEGKTVRKGEQIGTLGRADENGGWAPHLHVQVITDLLGHSGDFPGVAKASERAVWLSLCPDPNLLLGIPPARFPERALRSEEILAARAAHLGKNLSVSYRKPLKIVRGYLQYLYDETGRAYLDAVNNVPHVGHAHPKVVRAARRQLGVLNTNTRYLHDLIVRYAERLLATLPEPLGVCFFVNSGSEANDLALRLARAHTGHRDVIVLDGAYHGHLTSLIDISPYKFDGPGGAGAPPHTHVVPLPDPYRGLYRAGDPEAGTRYAGHVREAAERVHRAGRGVAAFIAESMPGCGGQIVFPDGYLQEAYRRVRAAGGVCIADEVQVGFGRVGSHFWGFETQGVVPDIVTMGKPIGNGHPLAAVVTTPALAASFANGMEYFNTFGGNPVSCAVGLAVLDVIEEEGLQAHALQVGHRLLAALRGLQDKHPVIGDVRGRGLYVGVELVEDRATRTPAADQAAYVVNRMREQGILMSTDGPLHNVLKIKPPLAFTGADADLLVDTLDAVLAEDFAQPLSARP